MARETQRVVRVVADYVSAFPNPITVKAGERLTIEDRETEWSGWLWCTTASGVCGWVPADFVKRGAHTGTARRDYDATELTVKQGEQLTVIEEVASWYWCRSESGSLGWVPKQNVEIILSRSQQHRNKSVSVNSKDVAHMAIEKKALPQLFAQLQGYFSPKVIGEVNDVYVKVTKVKGNDVPWHTHDHEDELFCIFKGSLVMEIAGQESFTLNEGELFIVKKGLEHRVHSTHECWILLIENKETKHTGDVASSITKSIADQL